ncbi:hypothetical protein [Chromobacterium haemolyticum]|nr:hypothetical protein [Chromobacterium haemolyticum]
MNRLEPKKTEELGLKWNGLNKAITKAPAGAPSPAYHYRKH